MRNSDYMKRRYENNTKTKEYISSTKENVKRNNFTTPQGIEIDKIEKFSISDFLSDEKENANHINSNKSSPNKDLTDNINDIIDIKEEFSYDSQVKMNSSRKKEEKNKESDEKNSNINSNSNDNRHSYIQLDVGEFNKMSLLKCGEHMKNSLRNNQSLLQSNINNINNLNMTLTDKNKKNAYKKSSPNKKNTSYNDPRSLYEETKERFERIRQYNQINNTQSYMNIFTNRKNEEKQQKSKMAKFLKSLVYKNKKFESKSKGFSKISNINMNLISKSNYNLDSYYKHQLDEILLKRKMKSGRKEGLEGLNSNQSIYKDESVYEEEENDEDMEFA